MDVGSRASWGRVAVGRVAIGMMVAAGFAWLVFSGFQQETNVRLLSRLNPVWLAAGLGLLPAGYVVRIVRWWLMLRSMAPALPFSAAVAPFLAGMALNNVLPLRAGDVTRAVGFTAELTLSPGAVAATLIVERLADLITLLALFFAGVLLAASTLLPEHIVTPVCWTAGAALVLLPLLVWLWPRLEQRLARLIGWAEARGHAHLTRLLSASTTLVRSISVLRSRRLAVQVLALSCVAWVLEGGMFAAVAEALQLHAGVGPWFALTTGTLGTLIPGMPGHVGTFDYFAMVGLTAFGVPQPSAAVFAVSVHFVLWVPVTVLGLLAWGLLKSQVWPSMTGLRPKAQAVPQD